jgi:hypothetical protein
MMISFTYDRQVLEFVKNDDHFLLVYPNTAAGRTAAKDAVREWLLNCELDFDRDDAQMMCKAIDVNRFRLPYSRCAEGGVPWGRRGT